MIVIDKTLESNLSDKQYQITQPGKFKTHTQAQNSAWELGRESKK